MQHLYAFAFVVLAVAVASSGAGEFNKKLNIGDPAPAWKELPGTDGKKHSLADLKDKEAVVVLFTCNSCPVAVAYEDRVIDFAKKYATAESTVAVVAINVNTIAADKLDKMQERAKEKGFPFDYLYDETQQIARDYGATYTPEFFVLNKERKVIYMGALDDKTSPNEAKVHYLEQALDAAVKGQKPTTAETLARGCLIRFARKRSGDD